MTSRHRPQPYSGPVPTSITASPISPRPPVIPLSTPARRAELGQFNIPLELTNLMINQLPDPDLQRFLSCNRQLGQRLTPIYQGRLERARYRAERLPRLFETPTITKSGKYLYFPQAWILVAIPLQEFARKLVQSYREFYNKQFNNTYYKSPEQYQEELFDLIDQLKAYDILDNQGVKSSGYHFIYPKGNQLMIIKNIGFDGDYLPYPAVEMMKKFKIHDLNVLNCLYDQDLYISGIMDQYNVKHLWYEGWLFEIDGHWFYTSQV